MTLRTMWVAAAMTVMGALSLAGCQGDPEDGTATPAPTASEVAAMTEPAVTTDTLPADDAETTTAAPELSAEEQDQADVEEAVQAYSAALDQAMIGEGSIEVIYPFSRDAAREKWVTQVMAYEAQGIVFSGRSELEMLTVSVDGGVAEATACVDVSDVEAVDKNGDSFITEDRLDQTFKEFVLERDDSAEFGWYIVEDTNRNEPCDG